ncbi:hypothetical protein HRG_003146 [Hirsutella rhossiliensis]|uniref:Uncharacterized protein n=1 Tax=Hirsutella rhossiliensis TaxID=111463 RepID=A0A9P8N1G9_9HYPO|nr:uncharacterized protein HRG_03146 [Hirsutella rhossiliensis]KAH0965130.1 hypothetical protein HRG_03146 [Hirsutella rhossiliensis]
MTNPSPGPSLLQARGSEPHPHSLTHRRRHDSTHGHHHHRHRRQSPTRSEETAEQPGSGHETGVEEPSAATQKPSIADTNDLGPPNGVGPSESSVHVVKSVDSSSPTEVVHNASSPSPFNSTSSALYLRSAIETPKTLLAGSVLGKTAAIPTTDTQATAAIPTAALDTSSGSATSSPTGSSSVVATTDTSTTAAATTTDLTSATSSTATISATAFSTATTQSDESSFASASTSASSLSLSDTTSTYSDGGFVAPSAAGGARPPPSSDAKTNAGSAHDPEPQKVRIIGGVFGSVAGVAFLAVLVLLVLRYKKRRDAGTLLGGGRLGSTASGTLTGGDSMAMAERSGPLAVSAPFSSLTRKRNSRQPSDPVEEGGERGFYRVAGRKLPPVLITGGDGYSDPRESIMSGGSDYYRDSQAFDLAAAGGPRQLALGAPMRPVSGVPIMRSGPARTPVTENPFVDPLVPPATQDTPTRRPVSRASASKFHESI